MVFAASVCGSPRGIAEPRTIGDERDVGEIFGPLPVDRCRHPSFGRGGPETSSAAGQSGAPAKAWPRQARGLRAFRPMLRHAGTERSSQPRLPLPWHGRPSIMRSEPAPYRACSAQGAAPRLTAVISSRSSRRQPPPLPSRPSSVLAVASDENVFVVVHGSVRRGVESVGLSRHGSVCSSSVIWPTSPGIGPDGRSLRACLPARRTTFDPHRRRSALRRRAQNSR